MEALHNINFQILLKQHGGDYTRARQAWDRICSMGRFGNVPHTYEGGLDLEGMRVMLDEQKQKQKQAVTLNVGFAYDPRRGTTEQANTLAPDAPSDLEDRIKRIEDIAMGADPNKKYYD